jgi:glyoxalase family protein
MHSAGLHHVTAISGPARRNLDFYTGMLGLRLVKKTVNFDDPGTYHLYYGDASGRPGSILTFFPWDHVARGRLGIGETEQTSLRVARSAIGFWTQRFVAAGVPHEAPEKRFGNTVLPFKDPDGLALALIGVDDIGDEPAWSGGDIPAEHALRGFHGVALMLPEAGPTAEILKDVFGYAEIGREGNLTRFAAEGEEYGRVVDLRHVGDFLPGRTGGGTVHHIAFRATDDDAQAWMVKRLADAHGILTTEQKDRAYFRSVYFRSPGGVLFEIATDQPGFAVDEPAGSLGQALKLPGFLEPDRARIEEALPELA